VRENFIDNQQVTKREREWRWVSTTPCRVTPPLGTRGPVHGNSTKPPLRLSDWLHVYGNSKLPWLSANLYDDVFYLCFQKQILAYNHIPSIWGTLHHGKEIKHIMWWYSHHDPDGTMVILLPVWLTRWCTKSFLPVTTLSAHLYKWLTLMPHSCFATIL
jgi:hypothetical protein